MRNLLSAAVMAGALLEGAQDAEAAPESYRVQVEKMMERERQREAFERQQREIAIAMFRYKVEQLITYWFGEGD